ncbi:hypothetical protein CORC01_08613 [Colletotrichum orchidophilum]|uniref:Uncharacterized protein n=1 Tax=Colletotrichum orchidophilum TaxID=1209926 RepID=A0A1G4B3Z6_9PEZI|nr:uncharacterized protein CORC01_08613 [Colletotrichum orchidophilum]OHE96076.1 hypothetical protein CORC01_08613 [Colletotrichum orchidophilum]
MTRRTGTSLTNRQPPANKVQMETRTRSVCQPAWIRPRAFATSKSPRPDQWLVESRLARPYPARGPEVARNEAEVPWHLYSLASWAGKEQGKGVSHWFVWPGWSEKSLFAALTNVKFPRATADRRPGTEMASRALLDPV